MERLDHVEDVKKDDGGDGNPQQPEQCAAHGNLHK